MRADDREVREECSRPLNIEKLAGYCDTCFPLLKKGEMGKGGRASLLGAGPTMEPHYRVAQADMFEAGSRRQSISI